MTQIHRPARLATRAVSFRYGGRHHSGNPGGIIPLHPGGFVGIGRQRPDARPSDILEALDGLVRARLRQDRPGAGSDDGLDGAVCIYDPATATVTFAGARTPLLYGRGGSMHEIRGDRRSLGYRTAWRRNRLIDHVVPVEPGMAFFLFTDGIPDHMGGHPSRLLGRKRLAAMIANARPGPLSEQLAALKTALDEYRGEEPRRDDMTLIGFIPA